MNLKYRVVVGDDDQLFAMLLKTWLEAEGHLVTVYDDPEAFLDGVRKSKPDAVFLDMLFGSADGREICRVLRGDAATREIAIIMVSALRCETGDIAEGLEQGADDYLGKPLDRRLTLAKLLSVMQRFRAPGELEPIFRSHGVSLDPHSRSVRIGSREILLTRLEFDLLTYLLRRQGKVITTRQLLEAVFDYAPGTYDNPATVHVHISRLRKKLGKDFSARLVTLINTGYRLE
ncbi:MAG: response regulator transcription factor [Elusimicrobiota bacterium]